MRAPFTSLAIVVTLTALVLGCADPPGEGSACTAEIPQRPTMPSFGRAYYLASGDAGRFRYDILPYAGACRYVDTAKTVLVCGAYMQMPDRPDHIVGPQLTLRFARSPASALPGTVLRAGRHFTVESMIYKNVDRDNGPLVTYVDARAPIAGELILTVREAPMTGHDVQTMRGRGVLCAGAGALSFDLPFYDARRPSPPPLF